jgi:regulator of replication initiation timing
MKKLNLLTIKIDGGTQARVSLNQDVVKEYAESMREGDVFPPITVFFDGSEYWLADGFHRYFATKANSITSIEAEVKNGTLDDAILFAFSANSKRGLSMTFEDNRNIIYAMLRHPEWSKWTNTAIAKHIGVSSMTVGRVKATMEKKDDEPTVKKFIDKSGNEATVDTSKLKTKQKIKKPDVSTAPSDLEQQIAEMSDQINSLGDTVNVLSDENTVLRDKIAIGQWNASEIEKIDIEETVANLRERIRILEIDNKALRDSRDMYQNQNAELIKANKKLQKGKKV